MADNTIVIEIEIDGKKGFATLNKDALTVGKEVGESLADQIVNSIKNTIPKSIRDIGSAFLQFKLASFAINEVASALTGAFNNIKEIANTADEITKVGLQFEFLAQKAGGTTDQLRTAFANLSNGLVDTNDFLKEANVALTNLKTPTSDISKNFEAARRIAVGLGVDTLQAFESINQAVATGQTRTLRQIGLFVDAEQAVKNYGKSVGLATQYLSEAQKQTAIFEAIQKKVNENFGNVDLSTKTTAEAFKAFGVASKDLGESISIALNKIFGPSIQAILEKFTNEIATLANELTANYGSSVDANAAKQSLFTSRIKESQNEIERLKREVGELGDEGKGYTGVLNLQIQEQEQNIKKFREQLALVDEEKRKLESSANFQAEIANKKKVIDQEEIDRQEKIQLAREQLIGNTRSLQEKDLEFQIAHATTTEEAERLHAERLQLIQEDTGQKLLAIHKQYADLGLAASEQEMEAQAAILEEEKIRIQQATEQVNANLLKMRSIVQGAIVGGIASSFSALGKALVTGKNGFEAFGKAVLSALGSMAIQIGSLLVTIGLGFQALGPVLPVFGLSGAAAVAAGLGLIVLGGVLQALGGEGEGATAVGGSGVGAGGIGGGASGSAFEQPSVEQNKPKTEVQVNVQGNIFNGQEQARVIAENLQEFFDTHNGLLVRS